MQWKLLGDKNRMSLWSQQQHGWIWKQLGEWKKPDRAEYALCASTYINIWKMEINLKWRRAGQWLPGQGSKSGRGRREEGQEAASDGDVVQNINRLGMVSWVCPMSKCIQLHTLDMCSLLNVNYTLTELIAKTSWESIFSPLYFDLQPCMSCTDHAIIRAPSN